MAAKGAILVTMPAMALARFATVAFLAATPLITRGYRRAKKAIRAVTGGLFIGLGGLLPRG